MFPQVKVIWISRLLSNGTSSDPSGAAEISSVEDQESA